MKTFKKIGYGLLAVILLMAIGSFLLAKEAQFERSIEIQSPVSEIYPLVADYKNWTVWSPWEHLDPNMKVTYKQDGVGAGAQMCWSGNDAVGSGCHTLVETKENQSIQATFQFEDFGINQVYWTFESTADGATRVNWAITSDVSSPLIIGPYFGLFMESMMSPDLEKGLTNLKNASEQNR